MKETVARLAFILTIVVIAAMAISIFWHLLTPVDWHWLSSYYLGKISDASIGICFAYQAGKLANYLEIDIY